MNWKELLALQQLEEIKLLSFNTPQLIFKHSTRCSISKVALNRFESVETVAGVDFYLLDLLNFRNISNEIAEQFKVHHESPQIILIYKGNAVFDESHTAISMQEIAEQVANL